MIIRCLKNTNFFELDDKLYIKIINWLDKQEILHSKNYNELWYEKYQLVITLVYEEDFVTTKLHWF